MGRGVGGLAARRGRERAAGAAQALWAAPAPVGLSPPSDQCTLIRGLGLVRPLAKQGANSRQHPNSEAHPQFLLTAPLQNAVQLLQGIVKLPVGGFNLAPPLLVRHSLASGPYEGWASPGRCRFEVRAHNGPQVKFDAAAPCGGARCAALAALPTNSTLLSRVLPIAIVLHWVCSATRRGCVSSRAGCQVHKGRRCGGQASVAGAWVR